MANEATPVRVTQQPSTLARVVTLGLPGAHEREAVFYLDDAWKILSSALRVIDRAVDDILDAQRLATIEDFATRDAILAGVAASLRRVSINEFNAALAQGLRTVEVASVCARRDRINAENGGE